MTEGGHYGLLGHLAQLPVVVVTIPDIDLATILLQHMGVKPVAAVPVTVKYAIILHVQVYRNIKKLPWIFS